MSFSKYPDSWDGHVLGDPDCPKCLEETGYTDAFPHKCYCKEGCKGLVHCEFAGENYDEETNDAWPEFDTACDVCERPQGESNV